MSEDPAKRKRRVQGVVPPDEYERFEQLKAQWGIQNGDAFRRVFSAGLDSVEDKTLRQYLMTAVVNLAVIGVVMWVLGRVMPNIPADSASLAAFITFGIAALGVIVIGLLDTDWSRFGVGSREAAD